MTIAFITPKEFRQLHSPDATRPSRLKGLARLAEKLATRVENEWEDFSAEEHEFLIAFAYDVIQPRRGSLSWLRRLRRRIKLAYALLRGEEDMRAVIEYVNGMQRLINSILGAVERESQEYQEMLAAKVAQTVTGQGDSRTLTSEERREWLKEVSRRALN